MRDIISAFDGSEWQTRQQLVSSGLSTRRIAGAVARSALVEVHHDLYRLGGRPLSADAALAAALAAAGRGAVGSHRSAAHVWGLLGEPPPQPVVSVQAGRRPRLDGVVVHRCADLSHVRPVLWRGRCVTNPLRTVVDLAADGDCALLAEAIDTGLRRRLVTIDGVAAELVRVGRRGRPGVAVLRHELERRGFTGAPPASELERRGRQLLEEHGIAVAGVEVVVCGGRYRVDIAVTDELVVELLGYRWHSSPEALASDLVRANALVLEGFRVLQFSWGDVVARPDYVATTVRSALTPR